jgi:hypothetical protein
VVWAAADPKTQISKMPTTATDRLVLFTQDLPPYGKLPEA